MDEQALANRKDNGRVVCLHGKGIAHDGAWFMGLGGAAASLFRAPFELDEAEADQILAGTVGASSSQFSVLVSHCPPKDTKVDLAAGRWHVGSEAVRRFIEENRPTLVICGHIHEAQGIDAIGKTSIVNVGPAAHGQYASISLLKPVKIELERF